MSNYVIKIYDRINGDTSFYIQTDDIVTETKKEMKSRSIRPKSYESKTYPGRWPLFHEWTCTKGVEVIAHEIGV